MAASLLAGVTGLRAHQQLLDVVGNNLANMNTPGFKAARARFSDLLSDTKRPPTAAVPGRVGGTNPIQIGLGVKVAAIDADLRQGSIETTGNDLDLAIQGNGYFVLTDGTQYLYTRAGAFAIDEDNRLVDPATGFRVVRHGTVGEGDSTTPAFQTPGDMTIKIPTGTSIPGKPTNTVYFSGNLNSLALGPQAETLTSSQPLLSGGSPATETTLLNDLDSNLQPYVAGDKIVINGTDAEGNAINLTLSVDGTTTVGDIINEINNNFAGVTARIDSDGYLILQADEEGPASLNLVIADDSLNTGFTSWTNHNMVLTLDGKYGDTVTTSIEIFDSQGAPHQLTLVFQKKGNNVWDMTASIDSAEGTVIDGQVVGLRFNDDGSFQQVTGVGTGDADITIQFKNISQPQTISFFFGSPNGFDGLTQFGGASSAAATRQDGLAAGYLSGLSVNADGIIEGIFTNGRTLPLAQIALAHFANPSGLLRKGDNYYSFSTNSGIPLVGAPLTGGRGSIQSGALESSNVDVAFEFTRLITAQRGFQVNARIITATDEIMQELSNIIR